MALKKKMKAGDEIQARCTKCKKTSAHTVVAMVDSEIKKVECLVCGSTHKYYPPQEVEETPAVKKAKPAAKKVEPKPAAKKSEPKPAAKKGEPKPPAKKGAPKPPRLTDEEKRTQNALTEWRNAVVGVDDDEYKPYMLNGVFQADEYILHPHFGKGKVLRITGLGKMEVLFETGVRRLVYNFKTS